MLMGVQVPSCIIYPQTLLPACLAKRDGSVVNCACTATAKKNTVRSRLEISDMFVTI